MLDVLVHDLLAEKGLEDILERDNTLESAMLWLTLEGSADSTNSA